MNCSSSFLLNYHENSLAVTCEKHNTKEDAVHQFFKRCSAWVNQYNFN
jgi:predicted DNA-binding protein YlxM (UPF0122 family)